MLDAFGTAGSSPAGLEGREGRRIGQSRKAATFRAGACVQELEEAAVRLRDDGVPAPGVEHWRPQYRITQVVSLQVVDRVDAGGMAIPTEDGALAGPCEPAQSALRQGVDP